MNAPASPPRRATYQDVLDAPLDMVAEIVDGALYLQSRPAFPHGGAHTGLIGEIAGPFRRGRGGPGGWEIILEPEVHLGEDVLVPDIAGWRRERMPKLPTSAWTDLVPDWCCEVLSPSTRRLDLTRKRPIYAREGVRHPWFVDALAETLEAFELRQDTWMLIAALSGDDPARVAPFDAIEFPLGALWPD